MGTMTEEERQAALEHLRNPKMPDPFISHDFGVLRRDLSPRRTLRQRLRTLMWRRPEHRGRSDDRG
jgi:hypothetical protein